MGNPCPSNANKVIKDKGATHDEIKIVDRATNKVVLKTSNTRKASQFIGAYDLYIFHCKNGHRKHRYHTKYDIYINDELLKTTNYTVLNKDELVYVGLKAPFYFNGKRVLEVVEMSKNSGNNFYELMVKVDKLPPKYFFFGKHTLPTYKHLVRKIIDKLDYS